MNSSGRCGVRCETIIDLLPVSQRLVEVHRPAVIEVHFGLSSVGRARRNYFFGRCSRRQAVTDLVDNLGGKLCPRLLE